MSDLVKLQELPTASGVVPTRLRWMAIGGILMAGLAFPAGFAQAQDGLQQAAAQIQRADRSVCRVEAYAEEPGLDDAAVRQADPVAGSPSTLLAMCDGAGIVLGEMDSYRVFTHGASGAMVVEIARLGRTRVMLIQRDDDGQLAIEDIAGDIAVAAGRTPTGGLRGVAADYAGFARDGVITVADDAAGADRAENPGRGLAVGRAFSLADHNLNRRSAMAAARAANAGGAQ